MFPQGALAVFSALINHEDSFAYPHLMREGAVITLIDIGFRTTDFVVVKMQSGGSFAPIARLSGTADEGVINLHRDSRQAFKAETGGAGVNEFFIGRILKDNELSFELPPTYLTVEVGDSWARGSSIPSNQANPVFQRFYDQA